MSLISINKRNGKQVRAKEVHEKDAATPPSTTHDANYLFIWYLLCSCGSYKRPVYYNYKGRWVLIYFRNTIQAVNEVELVMCICSCMFIYLTIEMRVLLLYCMCQYKFSVQPRRPNSRRLASFLYPIHISWIYNKRSTYHSLSWSSDYYDPF